MGLAIDVVTLFPEFFASPLKQSLLNKAQGTGKVSIQIHNLRGFTHDRHKTADDRPYGGGAGMVMKPEPIFECVESLPKGWVVVLDPAGERLTQAVAEKLSRKRRLILIAGHYEGVDHRVHEHLADQEISVGDFITMGGEAPALCLIEAVIRLLPGVLGNKQSLARESFHSDLLEYPQYTRPRQFRGWEVPEILISGHHKEVETWRHQMAQKITARKRPDLAKKKT
ncbi:MAG: tRNA (guanosine(37)-N1)-methyltransferase TrmD [Candidatus Omnitrophica bacterium]|nr:tRNA (guanosine(37)-N1)-methyltransferase TrmD [Candidatus Omnitrophota bacterium]